MLKSRVVHHSILACPTSAAGHFRQIDPLPTLSACPLRSDRVRTFAPQRFDAVCHNRTDAVQQKRCPEPGDFRSDSADVRVLRFQGALTVLRIALNPLMVALNSEYSP